MPSRQHRAPVIGLGVALALMVLAMAVPAVTGWNVRINDFPPLHAEWMPRVGYPTPAAIALAVLAVWQSHHLARTLRWVPLLLLVFAAGLAWMLVLALVDGQAGVGRILTDKYEYLPTARRTTDFGETLDIYASKISYDAEPNNWPVHIAGHPPGALLFFVVLVRIGLGSGIAAGLVVTAVAATTAVGVLVTMRVLGAEDMARRAAPFLVFGPAAIWQCVSGDAMFAAFAAWGMAALAVAAVRRSISWSVVAGVLLGYCVMLSYGLTLLGILAIAVLFLARSWRPLPIAAFAALCVVLAFAVGGFAWWEGYSELRSRYGEGVGGRRPVTYWLWGSLGALCFSAGPLVGSGMAMLVTNVRAYLAQPSHRVTAVLSGAGAAMILVATASLMSKAEVERIWLPFVSWMLLSCAFLPERWRRAGLALQLAVALVTMHLIKTTW